MPAFQNGDVVRLRMDKTFEGMLFSAGTLATVVAAVPSLGACLILLGHDTTSRLVPEADLLGLAGASKPGAKAAKKGKGLRFGLDDRVKLREERNIGGVLYPKGSPGRVAATLESFLAYMVDFDQDSTDRMLPDSALAPE